MKILVLGSKGQLGCCLYDQLNNTDHDVVFTSREQIDIGDLHNTKKQILGIRPNLIINASAYTFVDKAEKKRDEAKLINSTAVLNIANICNKINSWLVHFSTDYVFDGKSEIAYDENDKTNPLSIYGDTKLMGEKAILSSGCKYIIIRTSWLFSEYGNNFLKTILRLSFERKEIRVVKDQIGSPTYAQDIAKVILIIIDELKRKKLSSCLYHFAGDKTLSWFEFSNAILNEALELKLIKNKPKIISITTNQFPTDAKRPLRSVLNSSQINTTFGINSSNCIFGIRSSLIAIKKNQNL